MSQNPVSLLSLLHPVLRPTLGHEVGNPAPLAEHFTPHAHVYTEREARQARLRQAQSDLDRLTR
ncbi:hypothetical protein [Deinococcus multiflagellatus]|uniref:hypothetical protein n=1 Tax=Deinococcus multiflagellatus TaxID=1656887 RepID=UPI001CCE6CBF|nr:hypothetical protein [Deinococcus multiflagellatus]MBZ9713477.1 hypothetical protein [Deinococcus multiflagellatus]